MTGLLSPAVQSLQFPVSAQDGIVAIKKDPPRLSAVSSRLPSKRCQHLSGFAQIFPDLRGRNVGRFLSTLLFPSGDLCCGALACPRSDSSSSPSAPLPCPSCRQDMMSAVLSRRTLYHPHSYFPKTIVEWNHLDDTIVHQKSVDFKSAPAKARSQ